MHPKARVAAALVCALGGGGAVALIPAASSASSAPTAATPMAAQTASLSKTEKTLLASNDPKTILMDPLTGDIISVTAGQASGPVPNISRHSICNTGDGCYFTYHVPYADEGFYGGAGTSYGSWAYRDGYSSGKWTVSACWTSRCGPEIGPNSAVDFTSEVTGTSFTIY
jgi:hypothetical protein